MPSALVSFVHERALRAASVLTLLLPLAGECEQAGARPDITGEVVVLDGLQCARLAKHPMHNVPHRYIALRMPVLWN